MIRVSTRTGVITEFGPPRLSFLNDDYHRYGDQGRGGLASRAVVGHLTAGQTPDGVVYTTRVIAEGGPPR